MPLSAKQAMLLCAALTLTSATSSVAAERPTLKETCDPRPDILVHPIYDAHVPYRLQYNRPRNISGWVASKIAPTSQEAMVWCENTRAGRYAQRDTCPMHKRYFAPKPWEAMQIGARRDTTKPQSPQPVAKSPAAPSQPPEPMPNDPAPVPVPSPVPAPDLSTPVR